MQEQQTQLNKLQILLHQVIVKSKEVAHEIHVRKTDMKGHRQVLKAKEHELKDDIEEKSDDLAELQAKQDDWTAKKESKLAYLIMAKAAGDAELIDKRQDSVDKATKYLEDTAAKIVAVKESLQELNAELADVHLELSGSKAQRKEFAQRKYEELHELHWKRGKVKAAIAELEGEIGRMRDDLLLLHDQFPQINDAILREQQMLDTIELHSQGEGEGKGNKDATDSAVVEEAYRENGGGDDDDDDCEQDTNNGVQSTPAILTFGEGEGNNSKEMELEEEGKDVCGDIVATVVPTALKTKKKKPKLKKKKMSQGKASPKKTVSSSKVIAEREHARSPELLRPWSAQTGMEATIVSGRDALVEEHVEPEKTVERRGSAEAPPPANVQAESLTEGKVRIKQESRAKFRNEVAKKTRMAATRELPSANTVPIVPSITDTVADGDGPEKVHKKKQTTRKQPGAKAVTLNPGNADTVADGDGGGLEEADEMERNTRKQPSANGVALFRGNTDTVTDAGELEEANEKTQRDEPAIGTVSQLETEANRETLIRLQEEEEIQTNVGSKASADANKDHESVEELENEAGIGDEESFVQDQLPAQREKEKGSQEEDMDKNQETLDQAQRPRLEILPEMSSVEVERPHEKVQDTSARRKEQTPLGASMFPPTPAVASATQVPSDQTNVLTSTQTEASKKAPSKTPSISNFFAETNGDEAFFEDDIDEKADGLDEQGDDLVKIEVVPRVDVRKKDPFFAMNYEQRVAHMQKLYAESVEHTFQEERKIHKDEGGDGDGLDFGGDGLSYGQAHDREAQQVASLILKQGKGRGAGKNGSSSGKTRDGVKSGKSTEAEYIAEDGDEDWTNGWKQDVEMVNVQAVKEIEQSEREEAALLAISPPETQFAFSNFGVAHVEEEAKANLNESMEQGREDHDDVAEETGIVSPMLHLWKTEEKERHVVGKGKANPFVGASISVETMSEMERDPFIKIARTHTMMKESGLAHQYVDPISPRDEAVRRDRLARYEAQAREGSNDGGNGEVHAEGKNHTSLQSNSKDVISADLGVVEVPETEDVREAALLQRQAEEEVAQIMRELGEAMIEREQDIIIRTPRYLVERREEEEARLQNERDERQRLVSA